MGNSLTYTLQIFTTSVIYGLPLVLSLEEHFEYVQQLSVRHGWVTAFRYDIAVWTDVMCNHVNGAPGDPSVKREEFLEDALARTNLLQDGRIIKYDNCQSI